jgi:translation initiation factor 2 beta subunit (eIF-2beta)/eIF-5
VPKQLEQRLFEGPVEAPSVSVLGRSAMLITGNSKRDISKRYNKDKETLMQSVKSYVAIASREDAEMELVQKGQIWETIKQLLDEHS